MNDMMERKAQEGNIKSQRIGKMFDNIFADKRTISVREHLRWRWRYIKDVAYDVQYTVCNHIKWHKTMRHRVGATNGRKQISSLKNIHAMLKYYPPEEYKGGNRIWRLLLDERSVSIHLRQEEIFLGRILAEARLADNWFYDKDSNRLELVVENGNDIIFLTVIAATEELFMDILKTIFANGKKDARLWHIIVAGSWTQVGDDQTHFKTTIKSKRQIMLI